MSSGSEREQELRRLLSEAVEPVEPAPGAQTRLLARARAQQRLRSRPLMARLGVPAAAVSFLAIIVLAVVFVGQANRGSSGSSASTTEAGGAPSRAPSSSSAAASSLNPAVASPEVKGPSRKELSNQKGASTTYNGTATSADASATQPQADSLRPSDLDGDGRPDTFTVTAGRLTANLSRDGTQSVDLPEFGPGAKVLGVSALTDQNGAAVAVVFVRLRQVGSSATDTIVSLVGGRLTVLQLGSGPALLTIDASHGYGCSQGTLAVSGNATPFAVEGSSLVPSGVVRVAAATPLAKATGCVF